MYRSQRVVRGLVEFACVFLWLAGGVVAEEYFLTPETDMKPLLKQVQAGDVFILGNGRWQDVRLKFELLPGTVDAPIHIRAETPGQVVFSGASQFRFSGEYVIVSGLVFRDIRDVSDVVQLRTHSERHAHRCRFTNCSFEQSPDSVDGIESRWLSVYGTRNRIDHCHFVGKKSRGTTLVVWVSDTSEDHRIDHNHFGRRPKLGRNGGETIRIGTSDVSESVCRTVVESNYFHHCDGEAEIVSNKSCENVYRYNSFDACSGALTLRHGHRCEVNGNLFLGRNKAGSGGVRIIGRDHKVTNNYFEGLRGDAERAAICIMNGIPDGPLNGFAPVRNAVVAHNTLVDCKVSMEFGVGAGKKHTVVAADCRFTHNLFLPGKWSLFRVHAQPTGTVWEGNLHQIGRSHAGGLAEFPRVDLHLKRAEDGLLRPTTLSKLISGPTARSTVRSDIDGYARGELARAGCDEPGTPRREWPTFANTGPTWMRTAGLRKAASGPAAD